MTETGPLAPTVLVLLGPPGAGKGTQARTLAHRFGLVRLATGDLLREVVADSTEEGLAARAVMDRGDLVTEQIVTRSLAERLDRAHAQGVILDGYPRTVAQAQALDTLLAERGRSIGAVLSLEVLPEKLAERICGRYNCRNCGEGYHDTFKQTQMEGLCDACGGDEFTRRVDDTAERVIARLEAHALQAAPLEEFYEQRGQLQRVNAMGQIGAVSARIARCVEDALV